MYIIDEPIEADVVIFDYSGTIADDREPVFKAIQNVMISYKELGIYDGDIPTFNDWVSITHLCADSADNYVIWGVMKDRQEILEDYYRAYEQTRKLYKPFLYEGAEEALRSLKEKGKKMGIVSAHPHESLMAELEGFGLDGYFDFIVGSVENKDETLSQLVKDLEVDSSRIIYVCDTNRDILSSKMAGVVPVVKPGGYVIEDAIDDMLNLLQGSGYPYRKIYKLHELEYYII